MQLARAFMDYMVLQRQMPIFIWGKNERPQSAEIKINQAVICTVDIPKGNFSFSIPPQEAAEDVTLEIGDICLKHVDIGEVWVAGGQSNMEFMLQYTEDGEEEISSANDEHLRIYTVGQYSFAGEREAGYKAWNPWDRWLTYVPRHAQEFPATAVYFAKKLRKSGIPVGILSCNWGGTSASAWIMKECLEKDEALKEYVEEFEEIVAKLDLDRYYRIKGMIRPEMASPQSRKAMSFTLKHTFKPKELERMVFQGMEQKPSDKAKPDKTAGQKNEALELSQISMEEIRALGPGEPNEPGTLYENMVLEIVGYSVRGVIWYQGETDEKKAGIYAKLFSSLIQCWREEWNKKNAAITKMPFLFVQLAPFGTWMGNSSENFPLLRKQQEQVSKSVADTYMASSSDVGNVYDIHPKNKKPLGERLALLAEKYVYGKSSVLADAPEPENMAKENDTLRIRFRNGRGLYKEERDFSSYNGFSSGDIDENLLPPVLDGVNGLRVLADGITVLDAACQIKEDQLLICSKALGDAKEIIVEFAQTGFYQVNLYNESDVPVKPFILKSMLISK